MCEDVLIVSRNSLFHLCYVQLDVSFHLEVLIMSIVHLFLNSILEVLHL